MRWTLRVAALLLGLLALYTAWPFWGLYKLARTVATREAAALARLVDFKELRGSLGAQVAQRYLVLTGQDRRLGVFGAGVAAGLGASVADALLEKVLTPQALLDLLQKGWPEGAVPGAPSAPGLSGIRADALGSVWSLYASSEYSGRDFSVGLPSASPPAQQYRLRLRLTGFEWMLVGIDLPEPVTTRLARALMREPEKR